MIHDPRRPSVVSCAACGIPAEDPRGKNGPHVWLCSDCTDDGEARRRAAYLPRPLRATVKALARIADPEDAERLLRRCTDDDAQLSLALEVLNDYRERWRR